MANYSRWDDVKKQRPAVDTDTRAGVEQDLAVDPNSVSQSA